MIFEISFHHHIFCPINKLLLRDLMMQIICYFSSYIFTSYFHVLSSIIFICSLSLGYFSVENNNISNNYGDGIDNAGILLRSSSNNNIYNNLLKNRNNIEIYNSKNRWNISQIKNKNIIDGSYIGGNFWAKPNGKGFSQT